MKHDNIALDVGDIDKTEYKDFSGGIPDDHSRDFEAEFLAMAIAMSMPYRDFSKMRIANRAGRLGKRRIERPIPDDYIVECDNTNAVMCMLKKARTPMKIKSVQLSDILNRSVVDDSGDFLHVADDKPRNTVKYNLMADSGLVSFFEFCRINMDAPIDPIDKGTSLHWNVEPVALEYVTLPTTTSIDLDADYVEQRIDGINRYIFRTVFSDSGLSEYLTSSDYWTVSNRADGYAQTWYSYNTQNTYTTNTVYV